MADDLRHAQPVETLPLRMGAPESIKQPPERGTLMSQAPLPASELKIGLLKKSETGKDKLWKFYFRHTPRRGTSEEVDAETHKDIYYPFHVDPEKNRRAQACQNRRGSRPSASAFL